MISFKHIIKKHRLLFGQLLVLLLITIFAPIFANDQPIIAQQKGKIIFPFLSHPTINSPAEFEWAIKAAIPYAPSNLDYNNVKAVGPFDIQNVKSYRYRHWLGTDELGRDVLSGIIYGTQMAIFVGLGSMLIAAFIGITLGASAGFWGNNSIKVRPFTFITVCIGVLIGYYLGFHQTINRGDFSIIQFLANQTFNFLILLTSVTTSIILGQNLSKKYLPKLHLFLPLDAIVLRLIELAKSIPSLFIMISLAAILTPSKWNIIWIIGVIAWTGIARYCRAEVMKLKNTTYAESAKALGYENYYILLKHLLPKALQSTTVYIIFGIASAILAESTLSFIGIGIKADDVSWGSILSEARKSPSSWWLAVFPGLAISYTLILFNKLAVVIEEN
jgi:peptide/nickel transport system permease protein